MYLTSVLASFVIYLCVSVSKLLPLFVIAVLAIIPAACTVPTFQAFAGIKDILQKRE
jgi:hypothetical protein